MEREEEREELREIDVNEGVSERGFVQFDKTTGLTAIVLSNNAGPSDAISRRIFATFPVP